jgi:hypothetical protein
VVGEDSFNCLLQRSLAIATQEVPAALPIDKLTLSWRAYSELPIRARDGYIFSSLVI